MPLFAGFYPKQASNSLMAKAEVTKRVSVPIDSTKKNKKRDVFYENTLKTIVIDPGHGGNDGGASGSHSLEKNIVLAIGKMVAKKIKKDLPGIKVIMTRKTDKFIPLWKRADIANSQKADLFISIHCNAFPNSNKIRGVETYVLGTHKTDANLEIVERENASIYFENDYKEHYNFDQNSSVSHIISSSYQNEHLEESFAIADKLVKKISTSTGMKNKGMKQAGFRVLRNTAMPAVLIETGYLTNRSDEKILSSTQGQKKIAGAIVSAIIQFKNEIENPLEIVDSTAEPLPETFNIEEETKIVADENFETDMIFAETEEVPVTTTEEKPETVPESTTTMKIQTVSYDAKPVIEFRVQLAASKVQLDTHSGKWKKIGYTLLEIKENGYYKYQAVDFDNYRAAMRGRHLLLGIGFKGAFVTAYRNGIKIPLAQALKY